jgi:hypothetical protein
MGKFDDVDDETLEKELKRRKASKGKDRVVILEGKHAEAFLKGRETDEEEED